MKFRYLYVNMCAHVQTEEKKNESENVHTHIHKLKTVYIDKHPGSQDYPQCTCINIPKKANIFPRLS